MYCGIQPSEINMMDGDEVELFNIFFREMKKIELGASKHGRRH
jgi:hypothetical protein